jgi:nucleotide-binding universal stress UspA family protein
MAVIVVGVDGSDGSVAALRWAASEARLRGARLRLVAAYSMAPLVTLGTAPMPSAIEAVEPDLERTAREAIERAIAALGQELDGIETTRAVKYGRAASVVTAAARDADLLVVGSRGLGGFKGLLLGSVSHQCVQHVRCPVVVIHR